MADEDTIARVARALCAADGRDPDEVVRVGSEVVEIEHGLSDQRDVHAPAWTSYASEARRLIAGARALGLLE